MAPPAFSTASRAFVLRRPSVGPPNPITPTGGVPNYPGSFDSIITAPTATITATNAAAAGMADLDCRIAFAVRVTKVREACGGSASQAD